MLARNVARTLGLRRPLRLGSLGRTRPLSDHWGADRGSPIDRYYIEEFLRRHQADIAGRVLEIKNTEYTEKFGISVTKADVLDIDEANPRATVVADLATGDGIPNDAFDCFVLTQTLQFIYRLEDAVNVTRRVLRPGGVLLATVPVISRIDRHAGVEHDFWRLTPAACSRLFGSVYGEENVEVEAFGNVLSGIGFLTGLAREELGDQRLDVTDDLFPVLVGIRARRG